MTTEIVKFNGGMTLGDVSYLPALFREEHPLNVLSGAWPGDVDPQKRRDRSIALLNEAAVHIANSEAAQQLCRCSQASILDALMSCARLDFSLLKALGHAYLIPFKGVCTLMPGYKGFIKLICETGRVTHIETVCVYEGDEFTTWRDEAGPHWKHVQNFESQGNWEMLRLVYVVANLPSGPPMFEAMNKAEIEKVRAQSAAVKFGKKGPWDYWPTEMARKSVIRRFEKSIPKGTETAADRRLAEALKLDNDQYDASRLDEYREAAQEASRSLKAKAMQPVREAAGDTPPAPSAPPAQPPAMSLGDDDPAPRPWTDKLLSQVVPKARNGESDVTDADWLGTICVTEMGCSVENLTCGQCLKLAAEINAGAFDRATGIRLPDDDKAF